VTHIRKPPKCSKCHSQMVLEHGSWKCLNDGQELSSTKAKHQFYEEHKEEIIAAYKEGGAPRLKHDWGLSGSTWFLIRKRWGVSPHRPEKGAISSIVNGCHGELPPWSDSWPEAVQLKYLDILSSLLETE